MDERIVVQNNFQDDGTDIIVYHGREKKHVVITTGNKEKFAVDPNNPLITIFPVPRGSHGY